jgi:hypothetical protein
MGCKISSTPNVSSEEQDSESSSEQSTLLANGVANGNGYGIERLTDSPSPERRPVADDGGSNAASASPDHHTAYPVQTDAKERRGSARRNGIRTEVSRGSTGSSGSSGSQRHTEPLPGRLPQHVASREPKHWGGGGPQNGAARGLGKTPPYLNQLNRQNSLKLAGAVERDGMIKVPRSAAGVHSGRVAMTQKGKETMEELSKAYRWRERFEEPTAEFLALMDRLYMECQLHLTALSSRGDPDSRREADAIVAEMVALRNYWGPRLLPSSTCNAFVRERIPLTLGAGQRQFRIDCAQFFEPVPFYGNHGSSCPGELMKLYRFSVYSVASNEVVLRYYLERSNVIQLYHVLCFTCENYRGQVRPYGTEPPSYWEVRQSMLEDVYSRLLSGLAPAKHQPPKTRPIYPANTMGRPAHLQVMPVASNT